MIPLEADFLIVEDMAATRELLKKHLKEMGFTHTPLEAESVEAALVLLDKIYKEGKKVDFIFSDWNLGDEKRKNGLQFLKIVREKPNLKDMPFLMITAENDINFMMEAANSGVTNYQVKPWVKEDLKRKMDASWFVIYGKSSGKTK